MPKPDLLKQKVVQLLVQHYGFKVEDSRFLFDLMANGLYQALLESDDLTIANIGTIRYNNNGYVFKPSNLLRRAKEIKSAS